MNNTSELTWRYDKLAQRYVADGADLRYLAFRDAGRCPWVVTVHRTRLIDGDLRVRTVPVWSEEGFATLAYAKEWAAAFENSGPEADVRMRSRKATSRSLDTAEAERNG